MDQAVSAARVAQFRDHGYVVIRGLFDPAAVRDLGDWTDELVALPEVPGRHMAYYEDSVIDPERRVLSRIENFCPYHKPLDQLLRGAAVLGAIGALLDEAAVLFKDKINFKLPGGDGFKAHQDVQAGWDAYADLHVTMLVSIDDSTADNGCLEFADAAHQRGRLGAMWQPLEDDGSIDYRSCPTRSGDVVFFDSFAPHRSGPNLTGRPRRVLYVTYNRASAGDQRARYYADKRRSFPPDCEREPGKEYVFRV